MRQLIFQRSLPLLVLPKPLLTDSQLVTYRSSTIKHLYPQKVYNLLTSHSLTHSWRKVFLFHIFKVLGSCFPGNGFSAFNKLLTCKWFYAIFKLCSLHNAPCLIMWHWCTPCLIFYFSWNNGISISMAFQGSRSSGHWCPWTASTYIQTKAAQSLVFLCWGGLHQRRKNRVPGACILHWSAPKFPAWTW